MNVLLIEDEVAAANRIRKMMKEIQPDAHIVAVLESVKRSVEWLNKNPLPDLIIADIQLADGVSLDIFKHVQVNIPVIFTTAYDQYTLKAFKLNSIDYLLKPIDTEELAAALDKYQRLRQPVAVDHQLISTLRQTLEKQQAYKSRFMIHAGEMILSVPVAKAGYIKADNKIVQLFTTDGEKHLLRETLEELEKTLDPKLFFRLNRSYIAVIHCIEKIENYFNGRLKISLAGCTDKDIYVSREKVPALKQWLSQ